MTGFHPTIQQHENSLIAQISSDVVSKGLINIAVLGYHGLISDVYLGINIVFHTT